jgi:hypothetical protein
VARVALGVWAVRYPLGGILSWNLQWAVGTKALGHEVILVEKAGWADSCFDPIRGVMTDDCRYGAGVVAELLDRHGLGDSWCYVDAEERYHGMSRPEVEHFLDNADAFVDIGSHGAWLDEAGAATTSVLVDGEPGYRQVKMLQGYEPGDYDLWFTVGQSLATGSSTAPDAGRRWRGVHDPVVCALFDPVDPPAGAPLTTIMSWAAHEELVHEDLVLGQRDVGFRRFIGLPSMIDHPIELAVGGADVPREELAGHGWLLEDAPRVTRSFETFQAYLAGSAGEFVVPKDVFVSLRTGCFSDRSAAYLASGRPVVMQDTGFSEHLPCGEGLFAVNTPEEAADAIAAIDAEPDRHRRRAREIAEEYLDAAKVLRAFYAEIGI